MRLLAATLFAFLLATGLPAFAQTQQSSYGFLTLKARNEKTSAVISWETIQELTITRFHVQQSTNGHDFVTVGSLDASYDTAVDRHQYRFTDALAGTRGKRIYYRLEIDVNNGRQLYSKTLMVRFDGSDEEQMSFWPNTVSSTLPVALETQRSGAARLQIIDQQGRVVKTENLSIDRGSSFRNVDVSRLPQGHYVAVLLADGLRLQQRFFRQ